MSSSNFPTTPGAYQTTPGSGFVLKIDPPADVSDMSVPLPVDGMNVVAAFAAINGTQGALLVRPMPSTAQISGFTDNSDVATSGSNVTRAVEDAFGNVVTGYTGTFANLVLRKRGTQTLSVTDTQNSGPTSTDSISVS
jgi:hypothetical protein